VGTLINKERLYNRLIELGKIGRQESGGITRLAYTSEDRAAKELVKSFMREAGLSVREDAVGNIIGRKEGKNPKAPVILTGSHIDSVYHGGIFDGALGVVGGIEVLQTMNEREIVTEHPIEVYAFHDEEGTRFSYSMLGSRGVAGTLTREDLELVDKAGVTIAQAMQSQGLNPSEFQLASRQAHSLKAFIELHIEQGKVLECHNIPVGIVTGIVNELWMKFTVKGEAGHAGATPMNLRKDALVTASEIVQMIDREARKTGSTVATVGKLSVQPCGINIIPGTVEFTLDLRDLRQEVSDQVENVILSQARQICETKGLSIEWEILQRIPPSPCSEEFQIAAENAFRTLGLTPYKLHSGAGHDAMHLAPLCPIGMIFIRSKDGISHNPNEWSSLEDCAAGVKVLYHTLLELAN
jgi:allantoate deiminase